MHDPRRRSNIAFATFFGIVAVIVIAFYTLPQVFAGALLAIGILAGLMSLVMGLIWVGEARRLARMRRGEGVIARWTLDPTAWREHVEQCRSRPVPEQERIICFGETCEPSTGGVEVVFTEDSVWVGDHFLDLGGGRNPEARLYDAWIDFSFGNSEGADFIRVPVAQRARREAERVERHFNAIREKWLNSSSPSR